MFAILTLYEFPSAKHDYIYIIMQLCTVDLQTFQDMGQRLLRMVFHLEPESSIPVIQDSSYKVPNSVPVRKTENGPRKLPFANVGEKFAVLVIAC